ncbi:MAG: ribosome-associated translation inhibitor RaiA [Alphaproteobacteria bacterium]
MQIKVIGQQIDIGDSLRGHVQDRLENGVSKYFDRAIDAHVAFSHEGTLFRTHIRVHVGKGLEWESHADDADIHTSFNTATEHVEKQIRRQKRKIRDHHKSGGDGIAAGED